MMMKRFNTHGKRSEKMRKWWKKSKLSSTKKSRKKSVPRVKLSFDSDEKKDQKTDYEL